MLPAGGARGVYTLAVPVGVDLTAVTRASIVATDRFGATSEVRPVPLTGCAS
jgi:hypothetical protein